MRTMTCTEIGAVGGGVDWGEVAGGVAVVAAAVFAVATAPVSIPIVSVAGAAALVGEAAGGAMMVDGASK